MRVLVATVGQSGHTNPLVPLAAELAGAGHDVLWATGPEMQDALGAAGLRAVVAGTTLAEWFRRLGERTRGAPGEGVPGPRKPYWFVPRLFCEVGAADMIDDLLRIARDFRPDAVLFDSRCYAAPAVARVVGAAPVLRAVTTLLPPEVERLAGDAMSPLWAELGIGTPELAGAFDGLVLSEWPAALDDPSPYVGRTIHRVAPAPPTGAAPDWLAGWTAAQGDRPMVYATLGTVFAAPGPIQLVADALDGADVSAILTVGRLVDPRDVRAPANVRVERYVPQDRLLPHCAAVVSHGGSGTTLGALAHGLPHVAVPQGADQFINAALIERHGAGVRLLPPAATAGAVRAALLAVLADPTYPAAAQRLADRMRAGLSLADTAALVADHAASWRGAGRHAVDAS